jgi:hypothetical protein
VDSSNVAFSPLLDHIATGLAASFVEQMEEIPPSDPPAAIELEEGGK